VLAASWPGDRSFERKLKNRRHARKFCPICKAAHDPRQLVMNLDEDLL
jgi:hypothetical protein